MASNTCATRRAPHLPIHEESPDTPGLEAMLARTLAVCLSPYATPGHTPAMSH